MKNIFEPFPPLGRIENDLFEYEHPASAVIENEEEKDILEEPAEKKSFLPLFGGVIIVAFVLILRLFDLQIVGGFKNQLLAEGNRIRLREIPAPRGLIYDRNQKPLVKNAANYSLEIYPLDLPANKEEKERIIQKVAGLIEQEPETLKQKMSGLKNSLEPIVLRDNLDRETALDLKIKLNGLTGVEVRFNTIRQYLSEAGLSHLIGYIGKISEEELKREKNYRLTSLLGKTGLEKNYEKELAGKSGAEQVEVNSKGQVQRILADEPPQIGNNLVLELDFELQQEIAKNLKLFSPPNAQAAAIALDPQTGGVLAIVSLPDYDANIFTRAKTEEYQKLINDISRPLINRALAGQYPPGSTIKPFIALAGLEEKTISTSTTINDPGQINIGKWIFPDWKAHGQTDIYKAIAESCDVFFYGVGGGYNLPGVGSINGLGVARINKWLEKFGFSAKTGVDLPAEKNGLVPTEEWKRKTRQEPWYIGDTYHLSIGQGDLLVTPIQLAKATAFLANRGKLLEPHLVSRITNANGNEVKRSEIKIIRQDIVNPKNLEVVREAMRQAVTSGSGRQLNDLKDKNGQPIAAAGKTGSAQFGAENKTHSWFITFAPYENPSIALVVLVEGGGEGHETAVPVAKNILSWYFSR